MELVEAKARWTTALDASSLKNQPLTGQFRTNRNLMAQDEMKNLGFANPTITKEEVHESVLEREQDTKKFKEQVANGK